MNPLENVAIGMTGSEAVLVVRELTVAHHKAGMPEVYGTPMMIYLMEVACANAIHPLLPDGWISVGAEVHVRHLAATPVGRTVTASAHVMAIEGKSVSFAITAHDGVRQIGAGTHVRGVVNLARFTQRLEPG